MPVLTPTSEGRARTTAEAVDGMGDENGSRVGIDTSVGLEVGDGADVGDTSGPRPTVGLSE